MNISKLGKEVTIVDDEGNFLITYRDFQDIDFLESHIKEMLATITLYKESRHDNS